MQERCDGEVFGAGHSIPYRGLAEHRLPIPLQIPLARDKRGNAIGGDDSFQVIRRSCSGIG
jgi:hypothetical protein